jgi:hypothetical protein
VDEDVLKFITMLPPYSFVVPCTLRSGEIAPLKLYRDGLVTTPLWNSVWVPGAISYHRTSAPAPPATVCWVHSPTFPPCSGSTAETAWVLRVSEVSIS